MLTTEETENTEEGREASLNDGGGKPKKHSNKNDPVFRKS
jgi:hypothetical protein